MSKRSLITLAALAAVSLSANAAISVDSGAFTYSQSFDSLTTSTSNVAWANDSTLAGWSLFVSNMNAAPTYAADNGGSNAGAFRSYGTGSERALGGLGSGGAYFGSPGNGAIAGWIAVAFTNSSAQTLSGFTLSFDGEQWRNGGNTSAHTMVLEYGFGSSFAGVSQWVAPGGNFDWTSPVTGSTAATVAGNTAGLVADRGGSIDGLQWGQNETLWIRWVERNDLGNDHGLAIDNLSFSVTAVPEPSTYALLLAGLGAIGLVARRRRGA